MLAFDFTELIKRLTIVFFWNLFIDFLLSFIIRASLSSCFLLISLRADQWLHLWIDFLFYLRLEGTGHVSNVFSALVHVTYYFNFSIEYGTGVLLNPTGTWNNCTWTFRWRFLKAVVTRRCGLLFWIWTIPHIDFNLTSWVTQLCCLLLVLISYRLITLYLHFMIMQY